MSEGISTILIVEDYDDVRQILKLLLESENFRVLEATRGTEALEIIKDERPDIVLMDLALPGIDGFETIRRMRAIDGFQNTPVVVLTAYAEASTYESALRAGSNYFMGKPIDFDELAVLLKKISVDGSTTKYTRAPSQRAAHRPKIGPTSCPTRTEAQRLANRLGNLQK